METSHSIQVKVDAGQGVKALNDLRNAARGTVNDLRSLGNTGNSFSQLASSLNASSSAFSNLSRSIASASSAARSFASSNPFSGFTQSAGAAHSAVNKLTSAFNPLNAALSATIGGLSLHKFVSDTITAGTSALNLQIAVDSVASSSTEAGRALSFIRQTAQSLGQPLDVATKQFANFYTSARALGKSPETIENVWRGLSTAMSALHVSRQDQALFMRELQETYSMGKIDATRLIRSMATHLPGLSASMQQAIGVTGAQMHEMFRNGGLPIESWEKLATLLERRYGSGVATALKHSQGAVISLGNSFELLKQKTFDGGLDSGFATLANTINSILKPNVDSLSESLGTAFRTGFTALALFTQKLYDARGPLLEIGKGLGVFLIASTGIRIAAGGLALLLSPLGAAAALTALLSSQWGNLANVFSGGDAAFNAGSERLKSLTGGLIDMHKAALGAVESWTLLKSLIGGSSWEDAKKAASVAGGQFLRGEFGKSGDDSGKAFAERFNSIASKIGETFKLPSFDGLSKQFDELYAKTAPQPFHGQGDYGNNSQRYDAIAANHDMSESLKRVFERLSPLNKGLSEYRENLVAIAQMAGKTNPVTGKLVDDSELDRLRSVARERALSESFPAANKIQSLMDSVRLEQEALANVGGNTAGEQIKIEREFLAFKRDMLRQHIELTKDESDAVRALLQARNQLERGGANGFSRWGNEQKSAFEGMQDSIKSGLDSVADGISRITTEGKGKFRSLGDAIKAEFRDVLRSIASNFIKTGIRSLMADGIRQADLGKLFGDNGLNANISKALGLGQGVIDKAGASIDDAAKSLASTVTASMDVTASIVNINGGALGNLGGIGASGKDAFKPSSALKDSFKPEAVGGISPKAVNDNLSGQGQSLHHALGVTKPAFPSVTGRGLDALYRSAGLDKATESALKTVNPDLQAVMLRAQELSGSKIKMNALMGARTAEQQHSLYMQNRPGRWVTSKDGYTGLSNHQSGNAADVTFGDASGKMRWGQPGEYESFNRYVQQAARERGVKVDWGGNWKGHKDWDHWEIARAGKPAPALKDRTFTNFAGSDSQAFKRATQQLEQNMQESSQKIAQGFTTKMDSAVKVPTDLLKSNLTQDFQNVLGSGAKSAGDISKLSESIKIAGDTSTNAASHIGSLASKLASLGGNGVGIGDAAGVIAGAFSEGGYSNSPVSSYAVPASFWAGAPHYSEGTPNTSGGLPAILHSNEAVIPLSRGRSVPVELNGTAGGDTHFHNTVNTNVTAKDFDSFRKSRGQLLSDMHMQTARMRARNG